jgi:hypothetical protein
MPCRDYEVWVSDTAFIAVSFTTVRGRIASFTVRLVLREGEQEVNVARYDTAHGMPHRDTLGKTGRTLRKDWLPDLSFEDALSIAIEDLKVHYEDYIRDRR